MTIFPCHYKLLPYPLEYTVFRKETAFRSLKAAIADVQRNGLEGHEIEKDCVLDLQRCVQQCLREHRRKPLVEEALRQYKETVLEPLAKLVVHRQASLGEAVYVGDVISPLRQEAGREKLEALTALKTAKTEKDVTAFAAPGDSFKQRYAQQQRPLFLETTSTQPAFSR